MITATGCVGTTILNDYIVVSNVDVNFEADVTGGCDPLVVNFSDLSVDANPSNTITSWSWNFGGGNPSTFNGQSPPSVSYPIGVYDVSLTVTTQSGCIGTMTMDDYITVGQINSVSFAVDTLVNCIKTDFQFSSYVSTTPSNPDSTEITYFWDFTDGTSTENDPTYMFTSDTGYFNVMLVVDYRGCKDTMEIDSFIYINAPIAKFSPDQTLYCNEGSSILVPFNDEATHGIPSDDILMIYEWGDGTQNDTLDDPQLDGANAGDFSHQFTQYGSYTIEQVIHNYTTGCSDSITSAVDISFVNANFIYSNDSICQGDTLTMFDQSSSWMNPTTPHPLQEWEFNMGNSPSGVVNMGDTAYYAYSNPIFSIQNYTITLTATNSVGCSDQAALPITVLPAPFPVLSLPDPSVGCAPLDVTFSNNSMSFGVPIDYYVYTYSDNNDIDTFDHISYTSPNPNPNSITHTFVNEGNNSLNMTVVDVFGCYAYQTSANISITKPFASFSVDNVICNGDTINTTNSSTGEGNLTYEWYLDNFNAPISADTNASADLVESGIPFGQTTATHDLYLVATDGNGCKDTIGNLISVAIPWAVPNYSFTGAAIGPNGEFVCPPLFGAYVDSSFSFGAITEWLWNFGNGNQSILENPSNTYVLPGTYDLTLSVVDENGCTADTTLLQYVTIGGPSGDPDWFQQVGQCAQGAQFLINNPVNLYNSTWEMGDNITLNDSINFFYNYNQPGTYTPGVTLYDSSGCEVFYPLDPITVLDDGLNALFTANPNPADQNETITFVDASSSQQSTIVLWNWDFGQDQVTAFSNSNQYFAYGVSGPYQVTLVVTDALGCQADFTLIVNVNDPEIWLPNVITANNDGTNDLFTLPFDAFKEFNVVILNRWGNLIHEGVRDPANPLLLWDGTTDAGEKVHDGVYFYRFTGEMLGGTMVDKHGFVTVIESK